MATPNGGLITQTNAQYYTGTQVIIAEDVNGVAQTIFTATFDTDLTFGSNDPTNPNYNDNNFRLYTSTTGAAGATNRGGGGGGGSGGSGAPTCNSTGGAGGSGVVVIRYKYQN